MINFYKNKKILVTGGTGLIGIQLVSYLNQMQSKITVVSVDEPHVKLKSVKYLKSDLRIFENCLKLTKNIDYVFHLAGIKGSPLVAEKMPYSFMTPMLMFNTNMIHAAIQNKVKRYLYTSSVGVYQPASKMTESSVWKTFPSKNDWYAGWAKRVGELQVEACGKQFKNLKTIIVRPANVYGPYDNFYDKSSMVIPSLIKKFINSDNNKIEVLGDGKNIRDFIYSKDVARAMIFLLKKAPNYPINLGSGKGLSIKSLVNSINKIFNNKYKICYIKNINSGDKIRLLDIERLKKLKFKNIYSFQKGLSETIDWALKNKKIINSKNKRYSAFSNEKK